MQPKTAPRTHFPDFPALVKAMDQARADGDEPLRAIYEPRYERSQAHAQGWGTHVPLLASVIACTTGPVLEIGVGRTSTPLLVEMCRAMGRGLVGLESERRWMEEVAREHDYPGLAHFPNWSLLGRFLETQPRWAVIFIDNGPGEARLPTLRAVKGHADFVVCHDTFNEPYLPGFEAELNTWKYRHDYLGMVPHTSVVSDTRPYHGAPT